MKTANHDDILHLHLIIDNYCTSGSGFIRKSLALRILSWQKSRYGKGHDLITLSSNPSYHMGSKRRIREHEGPSYKTSVYENENGGRIPRLRITWSTRMPLWGLFLLILNRLIRASSSRCF